MALGGIWLFDAALQFQPFMFTRAFVRDEIVHAAAGNPAAGHLGKLGVIAAVAAGGAIWAAQGFGEISTGGARTRTRGCS